MSKARRGAKKSKAGKNSCPHCRQGSFTYSYLGERFKFDVDRAFKIVADGREPVEVDEESIRRALKRTRIYKEHLEHVDLKYPGIIAHVSCVTPEGDFASGHALIDGNHRAARALDLGVPFFAYVLTEAESEEILLHQTTFAPASC